MLRFLPEDAPVIVNGDDEKLRGLQCRQRKIMFGFEKHNDVRAESVKAEGSSILCDIVSGERRIPVRIPAFGQHHVYAALAAAAVGILHGLTDCEIAAGIEDFRNVGRRGELVHTPFVTMIDDSYNANPDSVKSGIDSLVQLEGNRFICILGDMLELGEGSGDMHAEVGAYAADRGADIVMTAGRYGPDTARGAGDKGMCFESRDALIQSLPQLLQEGDCVLVKASKGSHFEMVSAAIRTLAETKI
jgi:UDP-N-acetylmuramoyl-tripeptide--D-alanyl-D-alanine ligase